MISPLHMLLAIAAAGIARKIGSVLLRRFVITVGFSIAAVMFIKML
jgi:hypothetical protein